MSNEYEENGDAINHEIDGRKLSITAPTEGMVAAQFVYECNDGFCFETCYWDGNQWVCTTLADLSTPSA